MGKKVFFKLVIGLILVVSVCFQQVIALYAMGAPVAVFTDYNIEKAVRYQLNNYRGEIFYSDLLKIADLDLSSKQIKSITDLQYFRNLTKLNLSNNFVDNISVLSNLTKLTKLDLSSNRITDISIIANLNNLIDLDLSNNDIGKDISILKNLDKLSVLKITNTSKVPIENISILANLKELTLLDMTNHKIKDLSPLINLAKLQLINLSWNNIEDVTPLSNLQNLTNLSLRCNNISDVSALNKLKKLKYLDLAGNPCTNPAVNNIKPANPFPEKKDTLAPPEELLPVQEEQNNIVERPDFKIVVDGAKLDNKEVPIIINGSSYLPLRFILSNLGVPNDNQHIVWDSTEKTVIVNTETNNGNSQVKTKIQLKVGSHSVVLNNSLLELATTPVIYKNKVYIPIRFVSETMNKKVVWDEQTFSIVICDANQYEATKKLLYSAFDIFKTFKRYKIKIEDSAQSSAEIDFGGITKIEIEVDNTKQIIHRTEKHYHHIDLISQEEHFIINGCTYKKVNNKWEKAVIKDLKNNITFFPLFELNDGIYTGLKPVDTKNIMTYSGDISLKNFPYSQDVSFKCRSNINIDKETGIIKGIGTSGSAMLPSRTTNYAGYITLNFSEINGNFEIVCPEDL